MKVSKRGRAFISAHEGNPLTAYLDPVRVPKLAIDVAVEHAEPAYFVHLALCEALRDRDAAKLVVDADDFAADV